MFPVFTVVTLSQDYVKTNHTVHFKHMQFILGQLFLNKTVQKANVKRQFKTVFYQFLNMPKMFYYRFLF